MAGGPLRPALAESSSAPWWHHRTLFTWFYAVYGRQAPIDVDRWTYCATLLAALLFLACGVVAFIALNCATLPLGVFTEPVWRGDRRFRLLVLPGGPPLVMILAPIFLAVGTWHEVSTNGVLRTLAACLTTVGLALFALGCAVVINKWRSHPR